MAYAQYFETPISQQSANACTFDTTPPTFAGIVSATAQTDGSIVATWALATSTKTPIDYHIYIAVGNVNAASLFVSSNQALHIPPNKTQGRIFLLADETTYLVKDQVYTLGVRASDSQNYEDSNTALEVVTAIASGNLPVMFQTLADQIEATELLLAADHTNFVADHANFVTDHTNFLADHASFLADHANFVDDNAEFVTNLATFVTHLSTFSSYLTTLGADVTAINAIIASMEDVLASISLGGGVGLTARVDLETVLNVELIESV